MLLGFYAQSPKFIYDPATGRFRGYLKVCTFRAMRRRFGRAVQFRGVPLDEVDPELLEVEQNWNDVWEQAQLKQAMEAVRRRYGDSRTFRAFKLYVNEGRSPEEVGRELGLSADSVYKAKERVMAALREEMRALEEEHE